MSLTFWPPVASKALDILQDDVYSEFATDDVDPAALFEKLLVWIAKIRSSAENKTHCEIVQKHIKQTMARAVYGSNRIDRVGLGLSLTIQLCLQVFSGEDLEDVTDSATAERVADSLRKEQPDLRAASTETILQRRAEVVQHAKAFLYIMNAFVGEGKDLTEDLIKTTHGILTKSIPINDILGQPIPPEQYAGIYRNVVVGCCGTNLVLPKHVPKHMAEMCAVLKQQLHEADTCIAVDLFSLAAKYSMWYVQIHPFQDGNGRMCRMILNAILCRYAGIVVAIGANKTTKKRHYSCKKRRAGELLHGYGDYALFVLQRSFSQLRATKKKLAGKKGKPPV